MNAAHNDHVQVRAETGLIGFAAVVWFIVEVYRTGLCNAQGSNHNSKQGPKKCPPGQRGKRTRPKTRANSFSFGACLPTVSMVKWGDRLNRAEIEI